MNAAPGPRAPGLTALLGRLRANRTSAKAGIETKIGWHSFRATGITECLRNGGKLEVAQQMANHESTRTAGGEVRLESVAELPGPAARRHPLRRDRGNCWPAGGICT